MDAIDQRQTVASLLLDLAETKEEEAALLRELSDEVLRGEVPIQVVLDAVL